MHIQKIDNTGFRAGSFYADPMIPQSLHSFREVAKKLGADIHISQINGNREPVWGYLVTAAKHIKEGGKLLYKQVNKVIARASLVKYGNVPENNYDFLVSEGKDAESTIDKAVKAALDGLA